MTVTILLQTPLFWYKLIIKTLCSLMSGRHLQTSISFSHSIQKSEFIVRVDLEENEDRTHSPVLEDKPKTQVSRHF